MWERNEIICQNRSKLTSKLWSFSELQIAQALENCNRLFSLDDVIKYVEIWDVKHALVIMDIINQTFGDGSKSCNIPFAGVGEESAGSDDDNLDMLEEWNTLVNDDYLLALAVDNLSPSLLNISIHIPDYSVDISDNSTYNVSIPGATVCALEHMIVSPVED